MRWRQEEREGRGEKSHGERKTRGCEWWKEPERERDQGRRGKRLK